MIKAFKLFLVCLLTTSFILFPKPSKAETIYQPDHMAKFRIEKDVGIINIQGVIDEDTASQADQAFDLFEHSHIKYVIIHLHSLGGSVSSGMKVISDMTKAKKLKIKVVTLVDHGEFCASMCTAIFAAGASRIAAPDTIWIFHSPLIKLTDEELKDPVMVLDAKLAIQHARHEMLRVYRAADPEFTQTVLLDVINDDNGRQMVLYGSEIMEHTASWINFPIAD